MNAPNQGVFRYQVETGKLFRYIPCPSKDKSKDFPQSICVDKEGTVWVGTYGAGIYRYSPEQDKFVPYATEALKGDFIFTLCDYGDELIVGVHEEELKRFNKKTGEVSIFPAPKVHRKIIRYAVCFGDELWVGTQNGVYVINEKYNSVQHIPADAGGKYGLGDAIVDKIYRDREGGTWICTQFGGASYLPVRTLDFRFIFRERPVQSADDASVNWRKEKTEWCGLVHRMAVFATGIREHRLSLKFPSRLTVRMY